MDSKEKADLSRTLQEKCYAFPYHYLVEFSQENLDSFSQVKNNPTGYRYAAYLKRVLDAVSKEKFKSVADVGCGDGFFIKIFSKQFTNKRIVGIDLSENALMFARLLNANNAAEFFNYNILEKRPDEKFDIVTLIEVLEHIPPDQIDLFLGAICKMLQDDGKLIVTVPSVNLSIANIQRHFQHFNEEKLRKALSQHFDCIEIEYINKQNYISKIIHKIFTNSLFILNHKRLASALFRYYLNRFLHADKHNGLRLFALCRINR